MYNHGLGIMLLVLSGGSIQGQGVALPATGQEFSVQRGSKSHAEVNWERYRVGGVLRFYA